MKDTLFIGKITAAMTHEMKNVLAIIRESAGLAEDLLAMSDESAFPYKDKFQKIMGKIENQVIRGAEIMAELNQFSHMPEVDRRHEDLNLVLNQVLFLSRKLSRLNAVEFFVEQTDRSITLDSNPLTTRMLIYRTLEFLAPLVGKGSEIRLKAVDHTTGHEGFSLTIIAPVSNLFLLEKILEDPEWNALENEFRDNGASIGPSAGKESLLVRFSR
jgi:signal transduction histidine kinase